MVPLLAALLTLIPSGALAAQKPRSTPAAQVLRVEGEGVLLDGKPARRWSKAGPGSLLEVPPRARVWVSFDGGGQAMIEGAARLTFEKAGREGIVMAFGRFLANLSRPRGRFTVRTRSVVATVRGTEFFIEAVGPQETYVCACAGKVAVTATGGFAASIEGEHHRAYRFTTVGGNILQTDAGLERHSDEDLATLRDPR